MCKSLLILLVCVQHCQFCQKVAKSYLLYIPTKSGQKNYCKIISPLLYKDWDSCHTFSKSVFPSTSGCFKSWPQVFDYSINFLTFLKASLNGLSVLKIFCPKNLLVKPDKATFLGQLYLFILYSESAN